jgi:hypothetical protein
MGYSKKHLTKAIIMTNALVLTVIATAALYFFFFPQTYIDPLLNRLLNKCKTCQQAKVLAINNFKERNYQVITWGLIFSDSPTIRMSDILERDYQIKTVFGGCIPQGPVECYNIEMRKLLVSKYGKSFYKKAYNEARKKSP